MVRSTTSSKMVNSEAKNHHQKFYNGLVHAAVYGFLLVALVWLSFVVTNSRREVAISRLDYLVIGSMLVAVAFFTLQQMMQVVYAVEYSCPSSCDRMRVWTPLLVHVAVLGLAVYYLVRAFQDTTDDSLFELTGDVPASTSEVYGMGVFALIMVLVALLWRWVYVYLAW